MKKIKSFLRLLGLTLLVILSLCGVGFLGALFPTNRHFENKPINVERKDETNEEDTELKSKE
jgi:hypothetical protein